MSRELKTRPLLASKPPAHLSLEARQIWSQLNAEYDFPSDALLTLRTALEAFDRAQQARGILNKEGLVIQTGNMVRKHPAAEVEKNSTSQFLAAMRLLGFDNVAPGPVGRPPGVR